MIVNQAYRYELKPNDKQRTILAKHAGCARFAYNWGLARRIEEYKQTGKSSNAIEQHRQLNALKKTEFPWMYEVSKCAPQEALRHLDNAYQSFFRRVKNGEKPGFPKFKKKGMHDSFTLTTGAMRVASFTHVTLPKIGTIRVKEKTSKFKGRIIFTTVSRESDRWFVSFAVETDRQVPVVDHHGITGLDCNVAEIVDSENTRFTLPRPLRTLLSLLQRRSKQHSRKQKRSMNRKKSALSLARLHRRIKNMRRDFFHKLSTNIAKTKQIICVESLNIMGMAAKQSRFGGARNRRLSLSIMDAGWREFLTMLKYKTVWYGSTLLEAPSNYPSTKRCSGCHVVKKSMLLSERIFKCESCGLEIDRDLNAAINLMLYALSVMHNTGSSPGINACGEAVQQDPSVKQEKNTIEVLS